MEPKLVCRYTRGEYRIVSVTNTTEFLPGQYLKTDLINALINERGIKIVVVTR